jgi:hypothetical protein
MGVRSRRRQRKIKMVVFLYTMEKGRECRERERYKGDLTKSTPFRAIAKKLIVPCILHSAAT